MAAPDTTHFSAGSLQQLHAGFQGSIISPDDPHYEAERQTWNLAFQAHPALIVIPQTPQAVAAAVEFARQQDLPIAVQSTGHGVIVPADGSLLIKTNRMKGVQVDADQQSARVAAGAEWGEVLAEAQKFGLAPLLGSSPNVGVVGYTLGGGMGWLARKYGLAADSVLSFELVTPDGRLVQASPEENSELFWALRGGGGNFGVVTSLVIRLFPVREVYGGNLFYPIGQAKEVFTRYREWIQDAPDELTSSISIMNFPPIPQVPEFLRGQSFAIVRGCYCGPVEEGEKLVNAWREWQAPAVDLFGAMPFTEAASISNDPQDPMPGYVTGLWLREINEEVIDTLLEHCIAGPDSLPLIGTEIRHAGGAIKRVASASSPYGNRDAQHILEFISMAPSPEVQAALEGYIGNIKRRLQPHQTGGVYLNFLEGKEARQRTTDGYSAENYRRLQAVKAAFDPENRFRHSFDIPPAA